jgi:hypothetical protein
MKQLFVMAVVAGLLAAASTQQSFAQQYGGSGSTGASEVTLQRCAELNIPTAQCNDNAVLQAERVQIAESSEEKGSGTSMIATELGQMILFIGLIGGIFGGIAAAFYVMGRKTKQIPA